MIDTDADRAELDAAAVDLARFGRSLVLWKDGRPKRVPPTEWDRVEPPRVLLPEMR